MTRRVAGIADSGHLATTPPACHREAKAKGDHGYSPRRAKPLVRGRTSERTSCEHSRRPAPKLHRSPSRSNRNGSEQQHLHRHSAGRSVHELLRSRTRPRPPASKSPRRCEPPWVRWRLASIRPRAVQCARCGTTAPCFSARMIAAALAGASDTAVAHRTRTAPSGRRWHCRTKPLLLEGRATRRGEIATAALRPPMSEATADARDRLLDAVSGAERSEAS